MTNHRYHASLLTSIAIHLAMLGLIGLGFHRRVHQINVGDSQQTLSAYVYQQGLQSLPHESESKIQPHTVATRNNMKQSNIGIALSPQQIEESTAHRNTLQNEHIQRNNQHPSERGNGKPIPELVALLHKEIQKHQEYPESALQMEREGHTTLIFTLFPDGNVQELRILNSSGTTSLDEAAIAAVNNALPFNGVERYITRPAVYQITVGFELT